MYIYIYSIKDLVLFLHDWMKYEVELNHLNDLNAWNRF